MGILAAARAFGLDFIPIAQEPYDLVLRAAVVDDELLAPLWTLLQRPDFQAEVEKLGGYRARKWAGGSADRAVPGRPGHPAALGRGVELRREPAGFLRVITRPAPVFSAVLQDVTGLAALYVAHTDTETAFSVRPYRQLKGPSCTTLLTQNSVFYMGGVIGRKAVPPPPLSRGGLQRPPSSHAHTRQPPRASRRAPGPSFGWSTCSSAQTS